MGRERVPRLSLGLGRGARKEESEQSAALPPHSSSEVGTNPALAYWSGAGGARARAVARPPEPGWQREKGVVQERRLPVGAWPPSVGAGASPTTPVATQSAPKPTQDPSPGPRTPPLGVATVAALSSGDRR